MNTIVMTFGTFDLFHEGHRYFLSQAKKHGKLITVIATDKNVKKLKKRKAVETENERKAKVTQANLADIVVIGDEKNPMKWIEHYQPDIICLGYDQQGFAHMLEEKYPNIRIIRIGAYNETEFKSSILREKLGG